MKDVHKPLVYFNNWLELSGYIENRDVFIIMMLMLVGYNHDSYSSFKDP